MRFHARVWVLALLTGVLVTMLAPAAAQAAKPAGIESFFAANCNNVEEPGTEAKQCIKKPNETAAEELKKAEKFGFTQAAGHPNFGVTDFTVNTEGEFPNAAPAGAAAGAFVTHVRTDVAPGVVTNPQSPEKCSFAEFGEELTGTGLFKAPKCSEGSKIGENNVVAWLGPEASPKGGDLPLNNNAVYNLVQPKGLASDFGVALKLPIPLTKAELEKGFAEKGHPLGKPTEEFLEAQQWYAHTLIEGSVEWGSEAAGTGKADYHDYFEINVSPALPLISSRLVFNGRSGVGGNEDFLTNPSSCSGIGPQTTTTLKLSFANGAAAKAEYSPPIGIANCAAVPFAPGFELTQSSKASDATDALTTEFSLPHHRGGGEVDSSDAKTATVVLPEGITLNPSSVAGLEACTPAQIGLGTKNPIACPEGSKIGTVALNVPGLPNGSLQGSVYLGAESLPITKPPYILYVAAESERYGVIVRLRGVTTPNEATGQLTTTFTENPEQPFSSLTVHFNGGTLAPLANSLKCEAGTATTQFTPFSGNAAMAPVSAFEVTGCPATFPFVPAQSTSTEPAQAGGSTTFTVGFGRPQGNQYLAAIRTVLPAGVVGLIPTVTQCVEPAASAGTCSSASQIGTVAVSAGSGSPYTFGGKVYLTGPYEGAPFGLSIVVAPTAGPFELKPVVARARIEVNPSTAQVIATDAKVPSISSGIPTRIRALTVSINRQGFERNPTNCGALATVSGLTGSLGATSTLSTPFMVEGCGALAFAPKFSAASSGKTSRQNGASLETTISQPAGGANIKSVKVTLPKQLPSRLSTLQKACLEAVFAANPANCPAGSLVGSARANTPTLPGKMTGPAYLVSHGGAAFPDLDLILEANGVRVILVGNTDIKKGITTTTFASSPDVPVSSITVNLPTGPHSALTAFGDLCASPLYMPTVITGQNGKQVKQNTRISLTGCGVRIVGHKTVGRFAYLTVRTFAAGGITGSGRGVSTVRRNVGSGESTVSLKIPRSRGGFFRTRVRVGFTSRSRSVGSSSAFVTVTFR
jgi:hypothetical protein